MASLMTIVSLSSCGSSAKEKVTSEESTPSKTIVCYFSATGTTAEAAERIAEKTGGVLYEIKPEVAYTDADLDWTDKESRSSLEMQDPEARTAIGGELPDLTQYEVVFIGYPNWWNTHPTIINTFIESTDLEGKTIVPFMTSGGSTIDNSVQKLHEQYPSLNIHDGILMNHVTDSELETLLTSLD
ncbi:MAG: flavodoxin [Muribaculaceae bacterium]|nr:flavodoxin [Bacteroides sp.]MDE6033712.1 flavodoxin [Muribaculaceae bacterium]